MKYYYHLGINPSIENPFKIHHAFDRSRSLFDLTEIETLMQVGTICQPKTIEEMCFNSATNIVNAARDRKIFVMWSGGIDSTIALTEIIKIAPADQIVILMNDNSVLEYPDFYNLHIKDKFEIRLMDFYSDDILRQCIKEGIIVTGHITDNLFGEPHLYKVVHREKLEQSLDKFLNEVNAPSRDMYYTFINACPRKLVNCKDLFWWMNYALSYQFEQLCVLLEIDDMKLNENIFHFCDTKEWNDYAVSTSVEEKYPGHDYANFKLPLKKHLFRYTKDDIYTTHKTKVHSWRKYRSAADSAKNKPVYISTEWKRGWSILK